MADDGITHKQLRSTGETPAPLPLEVFTWPPKPAVLDPAAAEPSIKPAQSEAHPGRHTDRWAWLKEAEAAWLGVSAVSWREAAARVGWTPDTSDAYCPRCGTTAGPFEADADGCPACRHRRLGWSRAVRLGQYEGLLREAILAGKYTAWRRVCQELGTDLGQAVVEALDSAAIDPASVLVCPIATSTRRRLSRGVDHTVILSREIARVTGGKLVRALRREHRPPQQRLAGAARKRNVAGSFHPRKGACRGLEGRLVVLVDDVRTTGATMSAAARALRAGVKATGGGGVEIWAAVAGVTPRTGEKHGKS